MAATVSCPPLVKFVSVSLPLRVRVAEGDVVFPEKSPELPVAVAKLPGPATNPPPTLQLLRVAVWPDATVSVPPLSVMKRENVVVAANVSVPNALAVTGAPPTPRAASVVTDSVPPLTIVAACVLAPLSVCVPAPTFTSVLPARLSVPENVAFVLSLPIVSVPENKVSVEPVGPAIEPMLWL